MGDLHRRPALREGDGPRGGRRRDGRRDDPRPLGGRAPRPRDRPAALARQLDWVAKHEICSRPTGTGTAAAGTTTGSPPSTSSTTTCAPSGPSSPGSAMERLVAEEAVVGSGHRAAPHDPGLVPGPLPVRVAERGGHRELGFPRLRPGYRPAAPRPYDGPSQGNGRAHGLVVRGLCDPGRAAWTDLSS